MKNKKNIKRILASLFIIISFFTIFFIQNHFYKNDPPVLVDEVVNIISEVKENTQEIEDKKPTIKINSEDKGNQKFVSIKVDKNIYTTPIDENDSVYDAMKKVRDDKSNNFSFTTKEYPSIGYFISEINNIKGSVGHYWIYYVNDIMASVGVSEYMLQPGDIITWKQE